MGGAWSISLITGTSFVSGSFLASNCCFHCLAIPFGPSHLHHHPLIIHHPSQTYTQEESEHAIAAFRAACRLLPGDSQPMILMAKELVRTNYLSLALHLLGGALSLRPNDVVALNEIGVIYLRMPNRLDEAVSHLAKAVSVLEGTASTTAQGQGLGQRQGLGQSDLPSTGSLPRHREEILGIPHTLSIHSSKSLFSILYKLAVITLLPMIIMMLYTKAIMLLRYEKVVD